MVLGSSQVTVLALSASMEAMWSRPPPHVPSINQLIKYHGLRQLTGHRLSDVSLNEGHVVPFLAVFRIQIRIRIHRIHMFWASRIRIH
jgi:hypothetical protein